MEWTYIMGIVCAVFLSTNMDNLLCLIGFFSNKTIKTPHVFTGWFIGSLLLIGFSLIVAHVGTSLISDKYIGLLGLFPILIGLKGLRSLYQSYKNQQNSNSNVNLSVQSRSQIFNGAAVTLANGSDNISAYIPLFLLAGNIQNICLEILTFMIMIITFSVFGYVLVRKNKYLGQSICQYGTMILPFVLIFLGFSILYKSFST